MSSVLCFLQTDAADAGVVSATEELQPSQVDGTQRQTKGSVTGRTTHSVPAVTVKIRYDRH